jgi:hypothetical protein
MRLLPAVFALLIISIGQGQAPPAKPASPAGQYSAGMGIEIKDRTISVSPSAVQQLWGSASLDFPNIGRGACTDLTFPLAGAQPGDTVATGFPAWLPAGVLGMMFVPAEGVVAVRVCNATPRDVDPPKLAYAARILRSF